MSWQEKARCAGLPESLFFPLEEMGHGSFDWEPGRAICRECPVAADCLEDALRRDERYGLWAGLTPDERRSIRRGCQLRADRRAS